MVETISRRTVLQTGGGAAAAAAGLAGPPAFAARSRKKPNVLFVPIDDMNDWTGYLGGYPGAQTPNLDRLARIAGAFTRAYTPAPVCKSARAAVLLGVEPWRSGVYTNESADWIDTGLADRPTIVRFFRDAGYDTIGTGKIFHSGWRDPQNKAKGNDPTAWTLFKPLFAGDDGGARPASDSGVSSQASMGWSAVGKTEDANDVRRAEWLVDKVLSKTSDKPFFAAFGVRKPHLPWDVPQEWFDRHPIENLGYPLGALDVEHNGLGGNEDVSDLSAAGRAMIRQNHIDHRRIVAGPGWKAAIQAYLAAISLADHAIGIVLDGLLKGPNASNTIICVWSDHGWQLGEKLAWRKFTLWERATRVPLLIGGDGLRAGPIGAPISGVDLYPTLARLAVGEQPKGLDGISFADHLREANDRDPREAVVSSWSLTVPDAGSNRDKHFAVRSRTHRLIAYGDGSRELYDHRSDPWEWDNLLHRTSARVGAEAIAADLARHLPKNPAPEVGGSGGDDD